ncbi:lipid-A-disaccharide synthase [Algihabitans albus]|uniref:lipid-A-disaccharide synthase n=1 Tax=Algihabitans albus TaxID=2164067 RepID=UPI000E5D8A37|nr:lipid-A-disaccharide synthase [Algihabitans albus]
MTELDGDGPLVFLIAGEPSGDQLGAGLMAALKAETTAPIRFAGVGGPRMESEGLTSLFPMSDLAVMGLVEILPHLFRILRRLSETEAAARRLRPDVLITIDSPAFSLRVAKRLKEEGFPLVHYVAPSVWAWKPWRARRIAAFLDHLLALLPFEPPYFERHGLATTVVGHPAVEGAASLADGLAFRAAHGVGVGGDTPLLAVLPGSRQSEVGRLCGIFGETLGGLKRDFPNLRAVVPTVPNVADFVRSAIADWPVETLLLERPEQKYGAFAAADAALAASGTVAVELAAARVPTVIAYRVSPVSAAIARRLLTVRYASIPNLVLDRQIQPEFLQENCRPDRLAAALSELLADKALRDRQSAELDLVVQALSGAGEGRPSQQAAQAVLRVMAGRHTPRD